MKVAKLIGIYCFRNNVTNKVYVGSSIDISYRKRKHLETLRANRHRNQFFQRAFIKYGEIAFSFSVLETCLREELQLREDYWIVTLNSLNKKYGYNLVSADRREISPSTKRKISAGQKRSYENGRIPFNKGRLFSEEHKANIKRGIRRTFEGGRISAFKGKHVAEATKVKFAWAYTGQKVSLETRLKMSESSKGNKASLGHKQSAARVEHRAWLNQKPVVQFRKDGVLLGYYCSIQHAAKMHGMSPTTVSKRVHGHRATAGGFVWRFSGQ